MKIFAISDMHSYLTPTLNALKDAGWDENNPEHIIVVCGDALDRGDETAEMVEWLINLINKGKLIYVRGNHDILMQEMLDRGYSMSHDKHNGTQKSYYQLLNAHVNKMDGRKPDEIVRAVLQPLYDNMVNYWETERFVFVHSWIPTHKKEKPHSANKWIPLTIDEYMEDWREANDVEWESATWGDPFKMAEQGLNKTGKVLCVGHWHCSSGWAKEEGRSEFGEDAKWDIFKDEKHNVIFLDKCTVHTGLVNVLVIKDEFING